MWRLTRRVLLTLLICNWIYAELVLYAPQVKPRVDNVLTQIKIPTHDQWGEYYEAFEKKRTELVVKSGEIGKSVRAAL